jgi:hypothetical protein
MSDEYRAPCGLTDAIIEAVSRAIAHDPRFVVLSRLPSRLSLRIAKYPARVTDPEDVDVRFEEEGVYVSFHVSGRHDRAEGLEAFRAALAHAGCNVEFDEI